MKIEGMFLTLFCWIGAIMNGVRAFSFGTWRFVVFLRVGWLPRDRECGTVSGQVPNSKPTKSPVSLIKPVLMGVCKSRGRKCGNLEHWSSSLSASRTASISSTLLYLNNEIGGLELTS